MGNEKDVEQVNGMDGDASKGTPPQQLSRRSLLKTAVPALVGAAVGLSMEGLPQNAQAQSKLSHQVASYQEMPKNGQECSTCVQFQPPSSCKLVASPISPHGWCMFYAKKS